jgi:hypothetical protein
VGLFRLGSNFGHCSQAGSGTRVLTIDLAMALLERRADGRLLQSGGRGFHVSLSVKDYGAKNEIYHYVDRNSPFRYRLHILIAMGLFHILVVILRS